MPIRELLLVDTLSASNHGEGKAMRGSDGVQEALFTVARPEGIVPADHRPRRVQARMRTGIGAAALAPGAAAARCCVSRLAAASPLATQAAVDTPAM